MGFSPLDAHKATLASHIAEKKGRWRLFQNICERVSDELTAYILKNARCRIGVSKDLTACCSL